MKEIYDNAGNVKFDYTVTTTNQSAPSSSGRRCRGVFLCVGLLIVFLLAGLIGVIVHYHNAVRGAAADVSILNKKTCPTGWTLFDSSCYFLSSESNSWTKGREDCQQRGADLVVINSAKEQNFLSGFTTVSTWIGLNDRHIEGTWKWVDGSPLSVTYWAKGEPNNYRGTAWSGREDCAEINYYYKEWNDQPCDKSLKWICEIKM